MSMEMMLDKGAVIIISQVICRPRRSFASLTKAYVLLLLKQQVASIEAIFASIIIWSYV